MRDLRSRKQGENRSMGERRSRVARIRSARLAARVLAIVALELLPVHARSFPQPVQIDSGALTGVPGAIALTVTDFKSILYATPPFRGDQARVTVAGQSSGAVADMVPSYWSSIVD